LATISLQTTWSDGQNLTASALNGNFTTIVNDYNGSITNANISASAAIATSKISATFPSGSIIGTTDTQTLTNKRITRRTVSVTNTSTSVTINSDTTDMHITTAQAGALLYNNPSGTPTEGQGLWIAVTGTAARALTYDTQFESSAGAALPTTTVTTARLDIGFVWRVDTSKWHCVGVA
jgi:hypothetical protein